MAPIVPNPRKIKSFRTGRADHHPRAGAGRGAVLGVDRWHSEGVRRRLFSAAVQPSESAERVESNQPGARGPADEGRPHDPAWPAAGGCREGGWSLGRRFLARSSLISLCRGKAEVLPAARFT
jgi:hypothetical protein